MKEIIIYPTFLYDLKEHIGRSGIKLIIREVLSYNISEKNILEENKG